MSDKSSEKPQDNDEEFAPIVPPELSRVLHVDQLKSGHFVLEVEASEEERQGLAKRYDLIEVKNLTATLAFKPAASKSMIHVSANFAANVVQRCGVTLEPVPASVNGEYECDYSRDFEPEDLEIIEFDEETEEPPEPIIDDEIDAGIMLTEQFGLELDPFPRAPGADFDDIRKAAGKKLDDPNSNNPFAVLKKLK